MFTGNLGTSGTQHQGIDSWAGSWAGSDIQTAPAGGQEGNGNLAKQGYPVYAVFTAIRYKLQAHRNAARTVRDNKIGISTTFPWIAARLAGPQARNSAGTGMFCVQSSPEYVPYNHRSPGNVLQDPYLSPSFSTHNPGLSPCLI